MIARFVRNINPYPLGAGVTAPSPGVRLVLNRQPVWSLGGDRVGFQKWLGTLNCQDEETRPW